MSNRTYVLHCQFFRLDECLENADRQPRMLFNQRLAYSNHMPNGKDADASEVVRFGLAVIRKKPVDVRRPVRITGWCPRNEHTLQLAIPQHPRHCLSTRRLLQVKPNGQVQERTSLPEHTSVGAGK